MVTTEKIEEKIGKKVEKTIPYTLPYLEGVDAPKQEFYSIAGKDYILRRGETIDLPESVYNFIMQQEKEKAEYMRKKRALAIKDPKKSE